MCLGYQSSGRTLNTSALCTMVLVSSRRTQYSQALDGTMLTHLEKRTSKISFNNGHWCILASGSLLEANAGQFSYIHPAGGLARWHIMHMPEAKTKEHSFRLKQGSIFPHKVIHWEQAVWVLYLLVRKCPQPRPSLTQARG